MAKLLITDDDYHLRKLVRTYAELDGFQCEEAESGHDALARIQKTDYDLVLLDVMMPGIDGYETLASIRQSSEVPVILLTARVEEYDKLFGFNLGADDYVPKPFSPRELMARVSAVLKRANPQGHRPQGNLDFGQLCISPLAHRVTLGDKALSLTPKEYDLLLALAQNEHIVLSREQLLEKVWGYDYYGDARTVDTHIKSLREHLGPYRKTIQTVWGVGYKFEYREQS